MEMEVLVESGDYCCLCFDKPEKKESGPNFGGFGELQIKKEVEDEVDNNAWQTGRKPPEINCSNNVKSFQRLCKFLKVDSKKIIRGDLLIVADTITTILEPECPVFTGKLCFKCADVVDNFTKLDTQLELIQMKIQYCLHSLQERIKCGDINHEVLVGPSHGFLNYDIAARLRRETYEKCSKHFADASTRIVLNKLGSQVCPVPSQSSSNNLLKPQVQIKSKGSESEGTSTQIDEHFEGVIQEEVEEEMTELLVKQEKELFDFDQDYNAEDHPFLFTQDLEEADDNFVNETTEDHPGSSVETPLPIKTSKVITVIRRNKKKGFKRKRNTTNSLFECVKCSKMFSSKCSLERHDDEIHNDKGKPFVCQTCGLAFAREYRLKRHQKSGSACIKILQKLDKERNEFIDSLEEQEASLMEIEEEEEPTFPGSDGQADSQIESISDTKEVVTCKVCCFTFSKIEKLRRHQRSTTACQKRLAAASKEVVTGKTYGFNVEEFVTDSLECQFCKKVFNYKRALRKHIREVHLEKDKYTCNICFASFSRAETLRRHMKSTVACGRSIFKKK